MKPTNSSKATAKERNPNRLCIHPPAVQRVEIDFYPHSEWSIEVGNTLPAVTHRRHRSPVRHGDRPTCGFAPLELVIAAENEKRTRWQVRSCAPLWADQI